jgi:hypothetical protein
MDEPIVEVARAIRPFLTALVAPAEADELDSRIARILNASPAQDTSSKLRSLLASHEATSDFMAEVLDDAPDLRPPRFQLRTLRDASYQPMPGNLQPADAGKFSCPQGDYVWYRPSVGVAIPACPTHGVALARMP